MEVDNQLMLYIFSKNFSVSEIVSKLGVDCNDSKKIGDRRSKNSSLIYNENIWILKYDLDEYGDVNKALKSTLDKLIGYEENLLRLKNDCHFQCSIVFDSESELSLNLSASLLKRLGDLSFDLDIDVY